MESQTNQKIKFYIGENVDVKDKVNKWLNGQIVQIQQERALIHYTGWHPKFDQFISLDSGNLLKQWTYGKNIQINNRIDAYHPIGGWLQARVIQLNSQNQNNQSEKVKVHFFNYHPKYDLWVDLKDRNQVAVIGQKSKAHGSGKRKRQQNNNSSKLSELARQIFRLKIIKLTRQLDQNNLIMKQIGGDGNCLFRAISDQLYGQQTYHFQIRLLCMKYILEQKDFFQNFLVQDIQKYVQRKSKNGVWGDDIQIQALSQIYSRPIQIYVQGIKPIRTFHQESQQNIQPLRLAYIGNCHYNSIKVKKFENLGVLNTKHGQYQNSYIQKYICQKNLTNQITNKNRAIFSKQNPLQLTIQQRMQAQTNLNKNEIDCQNDLMKQIIQMSENQQIFKQIQNAELKQLQKRLQQQAIQKQIKRLQQQQLEEVKKLSAMNQKNQNKAYFQRPYWFEDLLNMGFSQQQILFAIQIKGYNAQEVQNFLFDNM